MEQYIADWLNLLIRWLHLILVQLDGTSFISMAQPQHSAA